LAYLVKAWAWPPPTSDCFRQQRAFLSAEAESGRRLQLAAVLVRHRRLVQPRLPHSVPDRAHGITRDRCYDF
jgi:hypothetical protein